jgi:hypothetical protein
MPTVWTHFATHADTERAIARLEHDGVPRERIDRIEGADGRWAVGTYVDPADEPHIREIMADPGAPTAAGRTSTLLICGGALLAGLAAWYLTRRSPTRRSARSTGTWRPPSRKRT